MKRPRFTQEFRQEAVKQVIDRGNSKQLNIRGFNWCLRIMWKLPTKLNYYRINLLKPITQAASITNTIRERHFNIM